MVRQPRHQANAATKYFNPALSASRRLVNELVANQQTLNAFLRNAARTTNALAQRRGDLANLVTNANTTAAAIGDENVVARPGPAACCPTRCARPTRRS